MMPTKVVDTETHSRVSEQSHPLSAFIARSYSVRGPTPDGEMGVTRRWSDQEMGEVSGSCVCVWCCAVCWGC